MIGENYIHFYDIDSTNNYLKNNWRDLPSETVVRASVQNSGYGRKGNHWSSELGGLWYSVLFKPKSRPLNPWHYVRVFSLAIYDTLAKYSINAKIKWPNDLLVNDKKICGIVGESIITGKVPNAIIVGIGINVNNDIPYHLKNYAVNLKSLIDKEVSVEKIMNEINHKAYNSYYLRYLKEKSVSVITKKWLKVLNIKINDEVTLINFNEKKENVFIEKITPDYLEVIDIDGNIKKIYAGEISVRKSGGK
ncbi:MAG: BirA family transcriptional regulator [Oceanotoga sp.]|jgi:BirA family biotin operon repressor/biotin-[acetyl-CoA-carboxylase] ligase|uniref:biotin--[acetyl-CoA-carboxylase] ligase n=1 Tax=Oceanotoga sp. TaxID=2108366 RepID=UPI00264F4A13|nr:biotin--[acetyl-CoA-carboxylase] ligase [Oceanotoga sp.]MDN5342312.1 BirA family transcriptional regulator [Oceanotoga sp.]